MLGPNCEIFTRKYPNSQDPVENPYLSQTSPKRLLTVSHFDLSLNTY